MEQDGRLDALKAVAANDYIFAVNEAVNHKMMYYAGVMTEDHYAYVGGPNATVEMGQRDGFVYAEMWIPVVKK